MAETATADEGTTETETETDEGAPAEGGEGAGGAATGGEPSPEVVASRRERRANRMREETAAREAAETARRQSDERAARLEREVSELRGYVSAQAQRDQPDPNAQTRTRVEALENEAQDLLNQAAIAARTKDADSANRLMKQHYAKLREAARIEAVAEARGEFQQQFDQFRQSIPNTQQLAIRDQLAQEYPWLYTDAGARDYAGAEADRLVAQGHPSMTLETFKLACANTAKRLGLGGRSAPTAGQQRRYVAPGGGEGGGGEEGGAPYVLTEKDKKLAHQAFKHLEPKAAEAKLLAEMNKRRKAG